ncbi:MAG: hypothetical protein F4Y58_04295 [Gammaproteobacteria bacterium]|nr:hypothetical protein [Gammaproteobacteria bacterium]
MSAQWNTALIGFMHSMGFSDFRLNTADKPNVNNIIIGDGRYVLDIEELDEGRGIILALFRKVPTHELYDKAKQILTACHYDKFSPLIVQTGLRGNDTLVLMVRVEQAWNQSLNRALDLMYKLYTDIDA